MLKLPPILSFAHHTNIHRHFVTNNPCAWMGNSVCVSGGGQLHSAPWASKNKALKDKVWLTGSQSCFSSAGGSCVLFPLACSPGHNALSCKERANNIKGMYEVCSLHEYSVENYPREPLSRQCAKEWLKNQLRLVWVFVMCQRSEGWFRNAHYL